MSLVERLRAVRGQIATACRSCGRDPESVDLLAVSKTRPGDSVREALETCGQHAFGENRVQELTRKSSELLDLGDRIQWHMIGSVQTNKVKELRRVEQLELLHSLDRARLADALQVAFADRGRPLRVLLQVNATGEDQKHGVSIEAAMVLADHLLQVCPALELCGLMAMGPRSGDPRPVFDRVAALRHQLSQRLNVDLPILSLGMTNDLDAAIAAGSTLVRVGTGVFGPRD